MFSQLLNAIGYKETYFLQTDITCFVISLFVLIKWSRQKKDISTGRYIIRSAIFLAMIFCLSDMIAGVIQEHVFHGANIILNICNIIYFASVILICEAWVLYSLLKIGRLQNDIKKKIYLLSIPFLAFFVLMILIKKLKPSSNIIGTWFSFA